MISTRAMLKVNYAVFLFAAAGTVTLDQPVGSYPQYFKQKRLTFDTNRNPYCLQVASTARSSLFPPERDGAIREGSVGWFAPRRYSLW